MRPNERPVLYGFENYLTVFTAPKRLDIRSSTLLMPPPYTLMTSAFSSIAQTMAAFMEGLPRMSEEAQILSEIVEGLYIFDSSREEGLRKALPNLQRFMVDCRLLIRIPDGGGLTDLATCLDALCRSHGVFSPRAPSSSRDASLDVQRGWVYVSSFGGIRGLKKDSPSADNPRTFRYKD